MLPFEFSASGLSPAELAGAFATHGIVLIRKLLPDADVATQREAVTREIHALAERGILRHNRKSMHFPSLELLEHEVSRVVGVIAEPASVRAGPGAPP